MNKNLSIELKFHVITKVPTYNCNKTREIKIKIKLTLFKIQSISFDTLLIIFKIGKSNI